VHLVVLQLALKDGLVGSNFLNHATQVFYQNNEVDSRARFSLTKIK